MSRPREIRFSWPALLLAPLPVGACGWWLAPSSPGAPFSWAAFAVVTAITLAIAYGGTVALAIGVALIGQWRPVNLFVCTLLGLVLALLPCFPLLWIFWASSGPDSGPPLDSFLSHLLRSWDDPLIVLFSGCGAITAFLYGLLARRFTLARPEGRA